MRITFFLHGERDLAALETLDPDRDIGQFQTGERAWILQTCLRLKQAGFPAQLSDRWPGEGIVIFSSKQRRVLQPLIRPKDPVVLVACREDVGIAHIADFEIVQNGHDADGKRRFFIPFWPQPGLIPRDPARGSTIRRVAYKGFAGNLHPDFKSADWSDFLSTHGLEWQCGAVTYSGPQTTGAIGIDWHDFSGVDIVLAVRPSSHDLHLRKPATKLYNAWLAGVPAILGAEYAYRELRKNDLDYLEVQSLEDARHAIIRLQSVPGLYKGMIENGLRRARAFTQDALIQRWTELLYTTIPAHANDFHVRAWRGKPAKMKVWAGKLTEALFTGPRRHFKKNQTLESPRS